MTQATSVKFLLDQLHSHEGCKKKKTTVREFTAKTMSQLLWENAMTGDQSNKKEFGTYTLYQVVFTTAMGHYAHTQAHT